MFAEAILGGLTGEVPTSLEIGGWIGCLFFLAAGVNQVLKVIDRTKEQPPPRDTYQVKGDYVTRRELDAIEKDLAGLRTEFREEVGKLREEMKHDAEVAAASATARAEKVHSRIDEVLSAMSELRERVGRAMRGKG